MTITQEELKKLLHYDPDTGVFKWIKSGTGKVINNIAGGIVKKECSTYGYIHISINGKRYYAHRLVFLYMIGRFPKDQVDHIDGNGLNNKMVNLREVDIFENQKNLKRDRRNKSGITGVRWNKKNNHWVAQITVNKKQLHLGCSVDLFEICCKRKIAEIKYDFHINHGLIK